jgi:hypothetical protein
VDDDPGLCSVYAITIIESIRADAGKTGIVSFDQWLRNGELDRADGPACIKRNGLFAIPQNAESGTAYPSLIKPHRGGFFI